MRIVPVGVISQKARIRPATTIMASDTNASQPISAIGPAGHALVERVAQPRAQTRFRHLPVLPLAESRDL